MIKLSSLLMIFLLASSCAEESPKKLNLVDASFDDIAVKLWLPDNGGKMSWNTEFPKSEMKCDFERRSVCAGGAVCKQIPGSSQSYTLINIPKMTYQRCDTNGCDSYAIDTIGSPAPVRNISVGSKGVIVKYLPSGKFIDIATQRSLIFISDGHCRPTV